MKNYTLHISDLKDRQDLFKFDKTKDNTDYYLPLKDIEIESINLETSEVSWKKITKYTVHKDLKMYVIVDTMERFERFWISDDHSLIVYDFDKECLMKISPKDIKKNVDQYSLVQVKDNELIYIPAHEIIIQRDKFETIGYDFTVEDNFTFCSSDGIFLQDTMAVFMPLSLESQEDCRKLMHIPGGSMNIKQSSIEIKHELILCAYIITEDKLKGKDIGNKSLKEIRENQMIGISSSYNVYQPITIKLSNGKSIKTSLGKAVFNSIFPDKFLNKYYHGFIDRQINAKFMNKDILINLLEMYSNIEVGKIIDAIIRVLGAYTSVYPNSLTLSEFLQADMFKDLKEKYVKAKNMEEKQRIINEIEKRIKTGIKSKMPMIHNIVASGSRGKPNQVRQILVTKGILQDAQGNILSIDESYIDGLSPTSNFMGGFGSRKGIMDRSRSTATTGYLFRKLIYALASVMYNDKVIDCKTKRTIKVKITKDNATQLLKRYIVDRGKHILLTDEKIKKYLGEYVDLRSPIYCRTHKICKTCYGDLMDFYHSKFIGIIAAQAMGERGTQEIMKTFHTGGSTDVEIPDLIQEALDNNPLIDRALMEKYFVQENSKLKFKGDYEVTIILKQSDYFNINITSFTIEDQEKSTIIVNNMDIEGTSVKSVLAFKPFVSKLIFKKGDKILDRFDLLLDNQIFLPYQYFNNEEYRDDKRIKTIKLTAMTKDVPFFANVDLASNDLNIVMQTILGIIEKKNVMKHPQVAFNKLSKIYGDSFGIAYNHIEILISQIFRNVNKPELPARLIEPYDAKVYGIKNISHLESFLSGMLFENMGKSLLTGFVSESTIHNPLEKLLSDDLNFDD